MYDLVMMSCLIVANLVSLVLLRTDLEGTSPAHAPTSTPKPYTLLMFLDDLLVTSTWDVGNSIVLLYFFYPFSC